MSAEIGTLTDQQILEQFTKLLAICHELKARGKLFSAYVYSIKGGKIHAEPVPPAIGGMDLPGMVSSILANHQQIRNWLSKSFDLNSAEWNGTAIGQMLNHIEQELRKQTNSIQEAARQSEATTHNSLTIGFLSGAMVELVPLLSDASFWKQRQSKKLARLNSEAEEFFRRNRNQAHLQLLGNVGELAIALDAVIAERGSAAVIEIIRPLIKMRSAFEHYLKSSD
jgi:hypothetical protein